MPDEKVVKPKQREVADTVETGSEKTSEDLEVDVGKSEQDNPEIDLDDFPTVSPDDYYLSDPMFHKIANYFGIEEYRKMEMDKDKISVIADWAKLQEKGEENPSLLSAIRRLEQELRSPGMGERRINNVYRYVRLLSRRDVIDQELQVYKREMEKNGGTDTHSSGNSRRT